uniref:Uncharacterized protein AlNc14C46G3703 n=1 Tax=Albugo laibachii Nc14 TaxID=890382 RepID=F0WAH8_9STRA|nr:conserved hypothetical protein [Albugo laibachii Nc14]|eukprot:CCA18149.1 conserved hypothetical protein [Albugo laibachii Nc14]
MYQLLQDVALLSSCVALLHYYTGITGLFVFILYATAAEIGFSITQSLTFIHKRFALVSEICWNASRLCTPFWRILCSALRAHKSISIERPESSNLEPEVSESDSLAPSDSASSLAEEDREAGIGGLSAPLKALEASRNKCTQAVCSKSASFPLTVHNVSHLERLFRSMAPGHEPDKCSYCACDDTFVRINSREPVRFENELFVGKAFLFVRTKPENPLWAHLFRGRRRMFWIQVQGKFKKEPRGAVFLGGELPSRISLGILTKSVALMVLGIIKKLVGKIHYSFGDSKDQELPHVAFPLYQTVDQFICTPEGQVAPQLGVEDIQETEQARKLRKSVLVGQEAFQVGPTYTFHFHTMYVDLLHWKTVNIPGINDMKLSTFFDSSPLRLVAYDVEFDSNVPRSGGGKHLKFNKRYLFCFEMHFDSSKNADLARAYSGEDESDSESALSAKIASESSSKSHSDLQDATSMQHVISAESAQATMSCSSDSSMLTSSPKAKHRTEWTTDSQERRESAIQHGAAVWRRRELALKWRSSLVTYLFWMEEVDLSCKVRRVYYVYSIQEKGRRANCFCIISVDTLRLLLFRNQNQRNWSLSPPTTRLHSRSHSTSYGTITEEAKQVGQYLELVSKSAHDTVIGLSDDEKEGDDRDSSDQPRRQELVLAELALEASLYELFIQRPRLQDPQYEENMSPASIGVDFEKRDRATMDIAHEGIVYRFHADEFLRQEVLVVTQMRLLFFRAFSHIADSIVRCRDVISVDITSFPFIKEPPYQAIQPLDDAESQLECESIGRSGAADQLFGYCFKIGSLAEEHLICVPTIDARDHWIQVLLQYCKPEAFSRHDAHAIVSICFAPRAPMKPQSRIILNSRALYLSGPTWSHPHDVNAHVTSALRAALGIHHCAFQPAGTSVSSSCPIDVSKMLSFLNAASSLRRIDLVAFHAKSSHEEKLAFYLNLYHLILAHGMLSHGFPQDKQQWNRFVSDLIYMVGVQRVSMSLAEIEHVILRARMKIASIPYINVEDVVRLASDRLKPFGLVHPDFRISFALLMNRSDSSSLYVFEADIIHDQLNQVAKQCLQRHVIVESVKKLIVLPRVCEWYAVDYTSQSISDMAGPGKSARKEQKRETSLYCARKLMGFLHPATLQELQDLLRDDGRIHTKYGHFKYKPKAMLKEETGL